MTIIIQPGGNTVGYASGAIDIHGEARDVYPVPVIRGCPAMVQAYLLSLAPAALRPAHYSWPEFPHGEPRSGFARHCEAHLYHLMICPAGTPEQILPHLPRLIRGTEDLLRLGLPREALSIAWFRHDQRFGTHAHGALPRTLPPGHHYELDLDPRLLFFFSRLTSFRFGFADPEHPAGFRPLYAGWVSATPENSADIGEICEAVSACVEANQKFTTTDVLLVLAGLGFPVLVTPDEQGRPQRSAIAVPPGLRVPLYAHTLVVASRDWRRIMVFKGPALRLDFQATGYRKEKERRIQLIRDLPALIPGYQQEFKDLADQRRRDQQERYGVKGAVVGLSYFEQLLGPLKSRADHRADPLASWPAYLRWSERRFPLATEIDLTLARVLPVGRWVTRAELAAIPQRRREEEEQTIAIRQRRLRQLAPGPGKPAPFPRPPAPLVPPALPPSAEPPSPGPQLTAVSPEATLAGVAPAGPETSSENTDPPAPPEGTPAGSSTPAVVRLPISTLTAAILISPARLAGLNDLVAAFLSTQATADEKQRVQLWQQMVQTNRSIVVWRHVGFAWRLTLFHLQLQQTEKRRRAAAAQEAREKLVTAEAGRADDARALLAEQGLQDLARQIDLIGKLEAEFGRLTGMTADPSATPISAGESEPSGPGSAPQIEPPPARTGPPAAEQTAELAEPPKPDEPAPGGTKLTGHGI
jgi:hypothetical protein